MSEIVRQSGRLNVAAGYERAGAMKQACGAVFFCIAASIAGVCGAGCAGRSSGGGGLTLKEGVLSAGVEIGYPPMEYHSADGKTLMGFDIDLAEALAAALGLRVEYTDVDWEGILAGLDTMRYDIALNITMLPERQARYNFTRPYIESSITLSSRAGSGYRIARPEDIAGLRTGYQAGTSAAYFIERLKARDIQLSAFAYDKILDCFNDLALKRIDIVAADNLTAHDYARKTPHGFEVLWQGPPDEYIGICLKKGSDTLTNALNNALEELEQNGTLHRLAQKAFNRGITLPVIK